VETRPSGSCNFAWAERVLCAVARRFRMPVSKDSSGGWAWVSTGRGRHLQEAAAINRRGASMRLVEGRDDHELTQTGREKLRAVRVVLCEGESKRSPPPRSMRSMLARAITRYTPSLPHPHHHHHPPTYYRAIGPPNNLRWPRGPNTCPKTHLKHRIVYISLPADGKRSQQTRQALTGTKYCT